MSNYIFVVLLEIPADLEERFNKVYNSDHLPLMSRILGVRRCDRYVRQWTDSPEMLKHLAIYQIDEPDVPRTAGWKEQAALGAWPTEIRPHISARRNGVFRKISTHRPGQGALKTATEPDSSLGRHIYFLQQSVPGEHVERFNFLYETDHLPLMMQVPGVEACNRYVLEWTETGDVPDYLAIYTIASPEIPRSAEWKRQTGQGAWPTEMRPKFTARRNGAFSQTFSVGLDEGGQPPAGS